MRTEQSFVVDISQHLNRWWSFGHSKLDLPPSPYPYHTHPRYFFYYWLFKAVALVLVVLRVALWLLIAGQCSCLSWSLSYCWASGYCPALWLTWRVSTSKIDLPPPHSSFYGFWGGCSGVSCYSCSLVATHCGPLFVFCPGHCLIVVLVDTV